MRKADVCTFQRQGAAWEKTGTLVPSNDGRQVKGIEVAMLSGECAALATDSAVYVFAQPGDRWRQIATLHTSDVGKGEFMGFCCAMTGARIAVGGALMNPEDMNEYRCMACIFRIDR
jgi:hypothetical protein